MKRVRGLALARALVRSMNLKVDIKCVERLLVEKMHAKVPLFSAAEGSQVLGLQRWSRIFGIRATAAALHINPAFYDAQAERYTLLGVLMVAIEDQRNARNKMARRRGGR